MRLWFRNGSGAKPIGGVVNEEEVVQLLEMNGAEGLSIEAKTGVDACGTERQCEQMLGIGERTTHGPSHQP